MDKNSYYTVFIHKPFILRFAKHKISMDDLLTIKQREAAGLGLTLPGYELSEDDMLSQDNPLNSLFDVESSPSFELNENTDQSQGESEVLGGSELSGGAGEENNSQQSTSGGERERLVVDEPPAASVNTVPPVVIDNEADKGTEGEKEKETEKEVEKQTEKEIEPDQEKQEEKMKELEQEKEKEKEKKEKEKEKEKKEKEEKEKKEKEKKEKEKMEKEKMEKEKKEKEKKEKEVQEKLRRKQLEKEKKDLKAYKKTAPEPNKMEDYYEDTKFVNKPITRLGEPSYEPTARDMITDISTVAPNGMQESYWLLTCPRWPKHLIWRNFADAPMLSNVFAFTQVSTNHSLTVLPYTQFNNM